MCAQIYCAASISHGRQPHERRAIKLSSGSHASFMMEAFQSWDEAEEAQLSLLPKPVPVLHDVTYPSSSAPVNPSNAVSSFKHAGPAGTIPPLFSGMTMAFLVKKRMHDGVSKLAVALGATVADSIPDLLRSKVTGACVCTGATSQK